MTRPTRTVPMVLTFALVLVLPTSLGLSGRAAPGAQPGVTGAVLDFAMGVAGAGGTVSWAGGDEPLVGTDIRVGVLTTVDAPQSTTPAVVGPTPPGWGVLSFSIGPHVEFDATTGQHHFSGDGTLTITGTVPDAGISTPATLFTGDLSEATIGPTGQINLGLLQGTRGTAHASLLTFAGLPQVTGFAINGFLTTTGPAVTADAFTRTVTSMETAARAEQICTYVITAVPTTCQVGKPPPLNTVICTSCPPKSTSCPTLQNNGVCTIKSAPIRGRIALLCAGVTLTGPQNATCQNGPCPTPSMVAAVVSCP